MNITKLGSLFLGLTLVTGIASASSVTGTYGLSGYLTVFQSAIDFGLNSGSPNSQTATVAAATGSFSLGAPVTVNDLSEGTGAGQVNPGGSFAPFLFIVDTNDSIDIDMTTLPIPADPVCTGTYTGPCRPNSGSPIVLSQITVNGMTTTFAQLLAGGTANFTSSPSTLSAVQIGLSATFTGETVSDVLTDFATNNFVGTDYSDKLVVSAVPEPATLSFLGIGLVSLGVWKKRKSAK